MDDEDTSRGMKRYPWMRTSFDIEGIVGALAAWLVGILLGMLWGPLFWLGAAGAVLVLLATRRTVPTPPEDADVVLTPCAGVVAEIEACRAPSELRMPGSVSQRIRISSSPAAANGVYAPVTGAVETVISEDGDPSTVLASRPGAFGLQSRYLSIESGSDVIGMKVMTGGFGPRLDIDLETGDALRGGRKIGQRRLGGWCDVYLPADVKLNVWMGQTLVGGETVLARLDRDRTERTPAEFEDKADLDLEPDDDDTETEEPLESDEYESEHEPETSEEAAAMLFERLKRETGKSGGDKD